MESNSIIPAQSEGGPPQDGIPILLEHGSRPARADAASGTGSIPFPLAVVAALILHLGVLLAVTLDSDGRVGAGGVNSNAVSIEVSIVSAEALEALEPSRDRASGTTGRLDRKNGSAAPDKPGAEAAPPQPSTEVREEPKPIDPTRVPDAAEPVPEPPKQKAATAAPDTAPATISGGQSAVAIANVLPNPTTGAAQASSGELQAYSISVVQTLSSSRPQAAPGMGRGTVRIVFEIDAQGIPVNVRISKSSGLLHIDRLVVEAIEATRFLAPPKNATVVQRTYELPYVFR